MGYVGTRTYEASDTALDAIAIETQGATGQPVGKVEGLEVVIHDVPTRMPIRFISKDTLSLARWQIYLILWSGSGSDLDGAAKRISELFSDVTVSDIQTQKNEVGVMVQSRVDIPEHATIIQ